MLRIWEGVIRPDIYVRIYPPGGHLPGVISWGWMLNYCIKCIFTAIIAGKNKHVRLLFVVFYRGLVSDALMVRLSYRKDSTKSRILSKIQHVFKLSDRLDKC